MNEFEEIKGMIRQLNKCDLTVPDNLMSFLGLAEGVRKYDAAMSKMIANKVKGKALNLCEVDVRHYEVYNSALRYLASKHMDFDSYMLYVEKNRDAEEQYYLPRRQQLRWLVAKMQRLLDDKIDILSISMPPGTGKALAMDAKVLTPNGFVRNDSLKVGDKVISGRGTESTILGVYPQGKKPIFCVRIGKKRQVKCSSDHLWKAWITPSETIGTDIYTTQELISHLNLGHRVELPIFNKKNPTNCNWEIVESIDLIGEDECQCIYIDDESHLYITDDYVITHNTTLGEFFMSFVMGHFPNTPNLMSSHSGFMTRMFYDAVLNIIKSNEYCWVDVFPDVVFESTNAKEETINLGKWQPFKTLTCRPIRASLTGVTRCEGYLYVDDLVSGIEEALSKERLDKLYGEYTTDLKSRKKKKAKEIHIATRWSVHDVIGRLERQYEGNERAEFIAVPDIDPETGESNFDYDYDVGFDAKYFKDMELSMDDVSYRCLYKSDPIEREGILYHPEDLKRYLGGLPIGEDGETKEPDAILAICDTKDTGTDYNFLGVFYQYGERFYLEDLVFKNIDPGTLDTLNSDMLVKHKVQQAQFESNKEGSRTANEVERLVKEKGGRCHITKKYTTQNKETKIIVNSPWVKEHVYFKDSSEYDPHSDYGVMMSFLCSYTQLGKNKFDDAPDGLAMFALFVASLEGGKVEIMSRSELGI